MLVMGLERFLSLGHELLVVLADVEDEFGWLIHI